MKIEIIYVEGNIYDWLGHPDIQGSYRSYNEYDIKVKLYLSSNVYVISFLAYYQEEADAWFVEPGRDSSLPDEVDEDLICDITTKIQDILDIDEKQKQFGANINNLIENFIHNHATNLSFDDVVDILESVSQTKEIFRRDSPINKVDVNEDMIVAFGEIFSQANRTYESNKRLYKHAK